MRQITKRKIFFISVVAIFLSAVFLFACSAAAAEIANNSVSEESSAQQILQESGLEEFAAPLSSPLESFLAPLSSPGSAPDLFIPTDTSWKASDALFANFEKIDFDDSIWGQAVDTSNYTYVRPWPGTRAIKSLLWNVGRLAYFRKTFDVPRPMSEIESAKIRIGVDDDFDLYLNGSLIVSDWDHYVDQSKYYDLAPSLQQGKNVIAIKAYDIYCCHRSIVASIEVFFKAAPALREPVVIVPGIGASRNLDLMLNGVFSDKWEFNTKIYDGLIQAFKEAGYTENKDLFVVHYDWRLPNAESAEQYLKPVIEKAKQESGSDKVNIITHSMGGLVARNYIQSADYQNDIDKLIMLGTPNRGSSEIYTLWEGALPPYDWSVTSRYIVNMYLKIRINMLGGKLTKLSVVKKEITSARELLPLYNYLIDKETGQVKNYLEMLSENVNANLADLNSGISDLISKIIPNQIIGENTETIKMIPVKEPSFIDKIAGYWQDGKPDPIKPTKDSQEGDNRVLVESAEIQGADTYFLESRHDELPNQAQDKIFEILGVLKPSGTFASYDPEEILSFWVASPVQIQITTPSGKIINKNVNEIGETAEYDATSNENGFKMITIGNPEQGNYEAELLGTGNGEYHFATSYFGENENIQETRGNIETGETITYDIDFLGDEGNIVIKSEDIVPEELIDSLIEDIENYFKAGLIDNQGIKTSLIQKLQNAKKNLKKPNIFQNLINGIQAQKDKHIFSETADEILSKIQMIINNIK